MGAKALFVLVRPLLSVVYLLKSEPGLIRGQCRGLYAPPEVSGHVLPVPSSFPRFHIAMAGGLTAAEALFRLQTNPLLPRDR